MSGGDSPQPPGAGPRLAQAAADELGAMPRPRRFWAPKRLCRRNFSPKASRRRWFPPRSTRRSEIGASKTIQAGAASASAVALTQGVLTTMKLAQLTFIGWAILATSLSVGGVIAVSSAAGQRGKRTLDANGIAVNTGGPQKTPTRAPSDPTAIKQPDLAEQLRALQEKVDELSNRSGPNTPGTMPKAEAPSRGVGNPIKPDSERSVAVDPARHSIRELEVELHLAIADEARTQLLFERKVISSSEREQYRGKVLLVKARLEGLDDELIDELDRLKLEVKKKKAELDQAIAQMEVAQKNVARNHRLNDRKPGMVDVDSLAIAEGELRSTARARRREKSRA